jgi:CheY-like chemotaxis protein
MQKKAQQVAPWRSTLFVSTTGAWSRSREERVATDRGFLFQFFNNGSLFTSCFTDGGERKMGYRQSDFLSIIRNEAARSRILVVDDNRDIRRVICSILEFSKRKVTSAANGEEALERMCDESFDLVLLDIDMPGMGGLEALVRIKRAHPQTRVIVISASTSWHYKEAFSRGAYGVLSKPFRVIELLQQVERALVVSELTGS